MRRELRIGAGLLLLLGGFIFFLLTVGSLGEPQPDVARISVETVLGGPPPADRFGDEELRISGWYAELEADCASDAPASDGPAPDGSAPDGDADWLADSCPLRVLMPYQPALSVTQSELETQGLRLSAPIGQPFPSRAEPGGPNLRLQQLVFVGHFDDPAAAACPEAVRDRCRNTFVVSDYDGLIR